MTCTLLTLLAAAALQIPPPKPPPGFWDQPTMIGDLGGVRPTLADAGVTFVLAFTGEVISNVDGGLQEDTAADMLLDWVIDADLKKGAGHGWIALSTHDVPRGGQGNTPRRKKMKKSVRPGSTKGPSSSRRAGTGSCCS
jgi:carbohydrate-selective porin OprB